ncbi:MAG: hypothetical protein U1F11_01420 [Steroidobacteraceae bacterium]
MPSSILRLVAPLSLLALNALPLRAADAIAPAPAVAPAPVVAATPKELLANYPNRLADIPEAWVSGNPIHVRVAFNLRYPPNSPEADEFLRTLQRTLTGLPFGVELTVERVIVPAKFTYVSSLRFRDWATYRAYETSAAFLAFYRGTWKPAVTETDERVSVDDPVTNVR